MGKGKRTDVAREMELRAHERDECSVCVCDRGRDAAVSSAQMSRRCWARETRLYVLVVVAQAMTAP